MRTIQPADVADARRLSALAQQTFCETFAAVNTAEDMDLHCRASYSEAIQREEILDPAMLTLLVKEGDALIGFAQLRWGDAPDCVGAQAAGEIQRLYIASEWHGKGVAQDLMSACLAHLQRRDVEVVWLGVWERNLRALAFYKKFGFVAVGDHTFRLGNDSQRDVVMVRPAQSRQADPGRV